ncbi:MAG: hypothetical protein M3Z35_10475 [Nitrospirota bacterium]|nr:hypothetical protein [Nitrospirota bacterium]
MRFYHVVLTALILLMGAYSYAEGLPSVTGTVQQYLLSPHGEPDGLLLSDGTAIKFPPHLGVALASHVKPGDSVEVIGFLGVQVPQGRAVKALSIKNTKTGQTLLDQPPTTPKPPKHDEANEALTVSGTVTRVLVNQHGDADGLILSGGEQVKFRPHQSQRVQDFIKDSRAAVTASGVGTKNVFGTVIRAKTIRLDGTILQLDDKPDKPRKGKKHR